MKKFAMTNPLQKQPYRRTTLAAAILALLALTGCASVNFDQAVSSANQTAGNFTGGKLELSRSATQQQARTQLSQQLLAQPLGQNEAVQLALANSPAVQALLAQSWQTMSEAKQAGQIANPIFSFERVRIGDTLDIGRMLSFGLLDLLTLPQRQRIASGQIASAQIALAGSVVEHVTQVRQVWVQAVAAQQKVQYAQQVHTAAEAGAELAQRMQQVGNFTRLQRMRQQAFYADTAMALASSQHSATAAREGLIRILGLSDAQAAQLQLPGRLPDVPQQLPSAVQLSEAAKSQRLDVQLARAQLESVGHAQGLNLLTSLVDVELAGIRNTEFENEHGKGHKSTGRGFEIAIKLPIFDWGSARRDAMNAQSLAAASSYESTVRSAASHLRESYSALRTAHGMARHYQSEVVPLRKAMQEENVLRYNGMLIGVFELLAGTREQIQSVSAAIAASEQFWLADAAMAASLIGKPVGGAAMAAAPKAGGGEAAPH